MRILTKRDITSSLATGLTTGVIAWRIFAFLHVELPMGIAPSFLVWLVPVLWLAGVQLGYILSMWLAPMAQFGKFAAIGFANAAVDFGVLYLLIGLTGLVVGVPYAMFKAASFMFAVVHSYLWNKCWTFDAGHQPITGREATAFVAVSVASLVINVTIASVVVALGPLDGLDTRAWAGVGAVAGSAVALVFNFIGLRMFVFRGA